MPEAPFRHDRMMTMDYDVSSAIRLQTGTARLISSLLDASVVLPEEWDEMPALAKATVVEETSMHQVVARLVEHRLLTPFQADMVRDGRTEELIVGPYRLLEPLGQGGMGIVYLAEHIHLRRRVALKMTTQLIDGHPRLIHRFYAEARAVARLQHPNIVACLDAGRQMSTKNARQFADYYVMEYVPGQDLDSLVRTSGALPIGRVADLFRQIADALAEAHKHGLVHRDLKPSNVVVTPDWQAKLLDFGLALHPRHQMTEPGTLLGTVGYMAPEQARDPHAVDGRADLFSLGATFFWALTGREPYPESGNPITDLTRRLSSDPPDVRVWRPELPADLAELVTQLMAVDPDRRYPSAAAVSVALQPFVRWSAATGTDTNSDGGRRTRVLVIDPDQTARTLIATLLDSEFNVHQTANGKDALAALEKKNYDLVVFEAPVIGCSTQELISAIRQQGGEQPVMVLAISGTMPVSALSGLAAVGIDDFMTKPFAPIELRSRVRALMGRRETLNTKRYVTETMRVGFDALLRTPAPAPTVASVNAWDLMTVTISRLLVDAGYLAPGYRSRVARYIRALSQTVESIGEYSRLKDASFVNLLASAAALYDIGMLVIPSGITLKPGRLDEDERHVVQTHPTAGAEILNGLSEKFPSETAPVALAAELVRSHHERWDGTGYPDRLGGSDIPLSARILSLVSAYDSLRSRRPYRPAMTHVRTTRVLTAESEGRFDPTLLAAFNTASARFEQIYNDYPI
ncbi:protein kinase domain-containing protein [Limnoglobus roseus]|uniref:HD domain-containing protein n=1 Tax=Limnoglobus roseus TaxID=2598579 RepID=A0A5C1A9J0_9BACT|nr:HD domain-containing phosphohydrolase [Limnoglobus roseus]QEL13784.1 HD domain-containing protein [Limnoglobus roseus]